MDDRAWSSLKDGDPLHAHHIHRLADESLLAAAQMANGLGASGQFVVPSVGSDSAQAAELFNHVVVTEASVSVTNLSVLTLQGYLVQLLGPEKVFTRPQTGEPCLNVYAPHFAAGQAAPRVRWEHSRTSDPRGLTLAEWAAESQQFEVSPTPFLLGAQTEALQGYALIAESATALADELLFSPEACCSRLSLSPSQQAELLPLVEALQALPPADERMTLAVLRPVLRALALELLGWPLGANAQAPPGHVRGPQTRLDRLRVAAQRSTDATSGMAAALASTAASGSSLSRLLDTLQEAVIDLQHTVKGTARDASIESVGTYNPEPYPGTGFLYDLGTASQSLEIRCVVECDGPAPSLLWGQGPPGRRPGLREEYPVAVPPGDDGVHRYQVLLRPIDPRAGTMLAVVLDPPVSIRIFPRSLRP